MKKESVISIIIPVYNAEKYIGNCIESLLNQTYKNIEIVLIDDGSKDSSLEVCKSYSEIDNRVHVYSKENEGAATARNVGIKYATGKYIQFIDSDDYVDKEYCKKLLDSIGDGEYQLGICSYYSVKYDGIRECTIKHNKKYSFFKYLLELMASPMTYYHGVLWNKIYIKQIIDDNNIRFKRSISLGEDFVFNLEYLKYVKKVRAIDEYLYYYVCYLPESLSKKEKSIFDRVVDRAVLFDYYKSFFEYKGLYRVMKDLVNAYIISFYVSEINRTNNLDIGMTDIEMELYKDYIYERCIKQYNVSKGAFALFRVRRWIRGYLYVFVNNGVLTSIYEKIYSKIKNIHNRIDTNKRILLYCNSREDEIHIIDYYNCIGKEQEIECYMYYNPKIKVSKAMKEFCYKNNINILNKLAFRPFDLMVCVDKYVPSKISNRMLPIMYIGHGNHEINDKNGYKSYPYKYYLNKSKDSNCIFSHILEPNKVYAKAINNRFEEFFGITKYVGYKWSSKIHDIKDRIRTEEKTILILATGYKDGLLNVALSIFEEVKRLIQKGYKVAIYINNYECDEDKTLIEEYYCKAIDIGITVIRDIEEYFERLAQAEVIICDYTSLVDDAILMQKPIILTEYNEDKNIWDFSINTELNKIAIKYNIDIDLDVLIEEAKNKDLQEIYSKLNEEISINYDEYKENVLTVTNKILKFKQIKDKELYKRQVRYMDTLEIKDRNVIFTILKEFDDVFTPSLSSMVGDIGAYADKLAEKAYFFVAKRKDEVVGFMAGYEGEENEKAEKEAYISLLGIKTKYQKTLSNGIIIGKLFQFSKEEGIKRGIKKVRIEVRNDNIHAIELYKKVGLKISSKASENSVYMSMEFSDFMA